MSGAMSHQNAIVTGLPKLMWKGIQQHQAIWGASIGQIPPSKHCIICGQVIDITRVCKVFWGCVCLENSLALALGQNQKQRFAHLLWDSSPIPGVGLIHKKLHIPHKVMLNSHAKIIFWEWCLTSKEVLWPNCLENRLVYFYFVWIPKYS